MPLPPTTRFSAVDTKASPTNKNNGLYAPELTQAEIDAIPAQTKHNGGIWYNQDTKQLEAVVDSKVKIVTTGGAGGGDVVGPANSTANSLAIFADTTGKLLADGNISINKVVTFAAVSADDNLASFTGGAGKVLQDSGIAKANVLTAAGNATATKLVQFTGVGKAVQESALNTANIVTNAGGGVKNNIPVFDNSGGKVIQDSGVSITQAPRALFRSSALSMAPNVDVNEIGNLGHIRFINDVSSIYVDVLTSLRFFPYNDQVCSVFTSEVGIGGESTSESALLEIHTDSGALLLSRLTQSQRDNLAKVSGIDGTNGMLLFNTDSLTFDGYDGTNWRTLPQLNTDGTLTVADPILSTNAATKNYVDAAVSGIPAATITLAGDVTGSGIVTSPITTTLALTLDQIKAPVANVSLNNKNITNLLDPTTAQQAATKNYVDTRNIALSGAVTGSGLLGTTIATTLTNITTSQITNFNSAVTAFRLDQFAAPTASLNLNSQKIINLAAPTAGGDATNKTYVDSAISGSGFAPGTAKYIIQTADPALTNAQSLGILSNGLLKNVPFGGTGLLQIATAGTDYYSPGNPTRIIDNTDNFFIGTNAGNNNSGTLRNTAVGVGALGAITSGAQENVAIGRDALKLATTAGANVGIGYNALAALTTSTRNVAVGAASLGALTTGVQNVAVGVNALNGITTTSNNISIGYNSGLATGLISCLFIGTTADASTNGLTNAIAIGAGALVNASNCMVLGGSGGNQVSVGIGITPNAQLQFPQIHANRKIVLYETANNDHQVFGFGTASGVFRFQLDATTSSYIFNAGVNSTTSNELMRLTGTGFLGIGTSSPNAQIHLSDTAVNRKIVLYGGVNDHQFYGFGVNNSILRLQVDSTSADYVFYAATSSTTSNELMRIKGNGRVGIGTTIPDQLLTVNSSTPSKITAGTWTAFSDARIKDIVGDYEHGLAEIIQIKTRKFKYNNRSGYPEIEQAKVNIGVVAQEIEEIFPECIVEKMEHRDIPDMRVYDGTALTYALINAVKELNNEIINLKQQINNKR